MKFRYKILTANIIFLSIVICIFGYFFTKQNMSVLLKNKIDIAIEESNLIQSNVEYQILLSNRGTNTGILPSIQNLDDSFVNNFSETPVILYIVYNDTLVYSSDERDANYMLYLSKARDNTYFLDKPNLTPPELMHYNDILPERVPDKLLSQSELGKKKYIMEKEEDAYYIYTCSFSQTKGDNLFIITKNDISEAYLQIKKQISYFQRELLAIVTLSCGLLLFISTLLTKPLEKLIAISNDFAKGNYSARASINTTDEIGILADTYNQMATSVENHVDELTAMISRQNQFIADFSHEVKTPMTAIIGYSEMLRSKEMSRENQITAASFIFSEGKRLESMSQKLFDFIYLKNHEIERKEILTTNLMESIRQSTSYTIEQKELTLHCLSEPAILVGDEQLLKSAFINLIDNARKASSKGSTIFFQGKFVDDGYSMIVKDQGIGIAPEHLSRITDEFYMVDKSRSRNEGGAGLGLSLAVQIFNCHNASFQIDSTPGKGTCITITFKEVRHG